MKQGWQIKKLGEVCDMYQPKTISTKEMSENGLYPVFGANGIIGKYDKYNHEEPQLLITCRGATCGSVNISEQKSWINGNAMVIKPKDDTIDLKFLQYLFLGGIDFSRVITGSAQPQITRQSLNPVEMSYPPLPEQKRIVAILDEAFETIARAKENTEQNLKNAKEIFESYLQLALSPSKGGVFDGSASSPTNKGDDWEEKKLGELTDIVNGGTPKTNIKEYWDGDIYWITPADLGKLQTPIVSETSRKISSLGLQKSSAKLFPENSVILSTRAPIGHLAVNKVAMSTNQGCRGIVPKKILDTWYLYYFLKKNVQLLNELGTGTTFKELSKGVLSNIVIPFPSIEEQQNIVLQLDALRAETQKLEAIYTQKLNDLEELQKSLLQKAFAGELVK